MTSHPMTMVEKIARAIYKPPGGLEDVPLAGWQLATARAVVEAMRDPTRPMANCGDEAICENYGGLELIPDPDVVAAKVWRAMIAAALREEVPR